MNAKLSLVDDDYLLDDEEDDEVIEEPSGGFEPLGFETNAAVVFSHAQKSVVRFRAGDLGEVNVRMRLGNGWYDDAMTYVGQQKFGAAKKVASAIDVAKYIIAKCQDVGPYVAATERRAGAWVDADGGLVINGEQLWRHDGIALAHGRRGDYVYPLAGSLGFGPCTPSATQAEVDRVLAFFRSYGWTAPGAPEFVLGWIGVAIVATALRRRPHVLVTGTYGSGKSTLVGHVGHLLGSLGARMSGSPTLMGLQQLVKDHPSRGIIIDEFEDDARDARRRGVFEAARAAYSLQEGDAGVVRGSTSGEAKTYRLSSPFMACGISPGAMEPADVSRWVVLELAELPAVGSSAQLPTSDEFAALGPRLARLFVSRWPVLQGSLEVFRDAIRAAGGSSRLADTYGHLLACYWTFVSEQVATSSDAAELVTKAQLDRRMPAQAERDEVECMNALLTSVRPFDGPDGEAQRLSIAEACAWVVSGRPGRHAIEHRLSQLGMRLGISRTTGRWNLFVATSPSHTELKKLFAGSKWARGGWGQVLRRLPGGQATQQRVVRGMPSCKATAFELPEAMQPAINELDGA